jgi:hypothetical protein
MLNITQWMAIPKDIREQLRIDFNIPKSSFVWVKGNEIATDGVTNEDLEVIKDISDKVLARAEEIANKSIEFICPTCNKSFKTEIALKLHKGRFHKTNA